MQIQEYGEYTEVYWAGLEQEIVFTSSCELKYPKDLTIGFALKKRHGVKIAKCLLKSLAKHAYKCEIICSDESEFTNKFLEGLAMAEEKGTIVSIGFY